MTAVRADHRRRHRLRAAQPHSHSRDRRLGCRRSPGGRVGRFTWRRTTGGRPPGAPVCRNSL